MSNRRDIQMTYNPHNKLTLLDCSFVVDSTNGNGAGIRSLKRSGRIAYVYMNTSAAFTGTSHTSTLIDGISGGTASLVVGMPVQGSGITAGTTIASIVSGTSITLSAATSSSTTGSITYQTIGNPNPAAGYIYVQLQDNYNTYLFGGAGFAAPLSGSNISISGSSVLTVHVPYVITSLGTSTQANWQAVGLPANMTAAVGVSFFATVTGGGTGTGTVQAAGTNGAGIDHIEVIGDSNLMNSNGAFVAGPNPAISNNGSANGMQFILACYKNGTLTAPTNNSVIGLTFGLNNSAQGV